MSFASDELWTSLSILPTLPYCEGITSYQGVGVEGNHQEQQVKAASAVVFYELSSNELL